jgi:hypothetical protein
MESRTPVNQRIGLWSALSAAVLSAAYLLTGVVWLLISSAGSRERLEPTDPFLAILESLIVQSAPVLVILMASVHATAPRDRKTLTRAALAFMTIFAALTSSVHFMQLTAVRQMASQGMPVPSLFQFYPWPSLMFALDLLAWDVFLGLALLLAAPAFRGGKLQAVIRVVMTISGALCLAGTLGPILGDLRLQYMGIAGYAGGLPLVCVLLAIRFSGWKTLPSDDQDATAAFCSTGSESSGGVRNG